MKPLGNICVGRDHFAVTNIGKNPDVKWAPTRNSEQMTRVQWKQRGNLCATLRKQLSKVKISEWNLRQPNVGGTITERDKRDGALLVSGCKYFREY